MVEDSSPLGTRKLVLDRWKRSLTGGIITAILALISAVPLIASGIAALRGMQFSPWWSIGTGVFTVVWMLSTIPIAAVQVAHQERASRIALEDQGQPKLRVHIEKLVATVKNNTIPKDSYLMALISVRNDGYESVTRKWQMLCGADNHERGVTNITLTGKQLVSSFSHLGGEKRLLRRC